MKTEDVIRILRSYVSLNGRIHEGNISQIADEIYALDQKDNPICLYCHKYKTLRGDGTIHQLCECSSVNYSEYHLPGLLVVTDEQIINFALDYVSHKDLKPANRGLIKDAIIIGAKAMRDGKIKHTK